MIRVLILGFARAAVAVLPLCSSHGAVVINEFVAASSERRLARDAEGVARLGTGLAWNDPAFNDASWSNGFLPAGYGFTGLVLDLASSMKDKTPSIFLRKAFVASTAQAESTNQLVLAVQYNDGFVAYLNGREVARHNCGPTNHYVFANEPAANISTNSGVVDIALGRAAAWLVPGRNVLAVQAHNAEQPSTINDPTRITKHLPTPEFRINVGLRIAPPDTNAAPSYLIQVGSNGGLWKYFVGRAEPSGGLVDLGLLTRTFVPPTGEEDDFDSPSAFSDWVELHNDGAVPANLAGWSLTDDENNAGKWRFPTNATVPAFGFLVILCDNRDEANAPAGPATYLHTNFRLNDEGGYLGLFDDAGRFVDGLPVHYPPQVSYCSYGRNPADPTQFVYLATASPGTTNFGDVFSGRTGDLEFTDALGTNQPGGLYTNSSLTLHLRPEMPGDIVRYTLDGSEPTEWHGFTYTNPLVLTQTLDKTGLVVRARTVLPDKVPSRVKTYTYILRQPAGLKKNAVLCFTGEPGLTFYDPDGLMAIYGGQYPTNGNMIWLANGPQSYNWAIGDGSPFEREVRLEYYFPPGLYPTNQEPLRGNIGLRLSASSYSRPRLKLTNPEGTSPWPNSASQKPSFNLFFNGEFGPGKLDYNLYTNYTTREFEHLRLRAGKNDISNPFITDELVRRLYLDMGQAGARGLFCSVYVNGIYRGIFNLCERFREQFFQAHFRSDLAWDVNYINTWVSGDSVVFNQLLAALDRDLLSAANWQAVTNLVDLDNTADYYLLNIYCAMWDWPGNNYVVARERSSGPLSRFRFGVWDAEGAFAVITSSRSTAYNTITNDLIVPPSSSKYTVGLSRIFRRLSTSPEFRLLFADHINERMFNGGVLDDRDPDGAGPRKHHVAERLDELVKEAGDLVKYSSGQAIKQTAFTAWWGSTNGRRAYLLGNTPGRQQFRDSGFWPVTEPPVFGQHGGAVYPGFTLSITSFVASAGQTANIYFTTDGSDPRRPGGALQASAQLYSDPILIPGLVTIKARARNNSTGEWSPLTAATFAPDAVPASAANLVLAELMYHPPDATAAELAAGYNNADDFEFARLQNIGPSPIDLAGVGFTDGVTFDFTASPARFLGSGGNILVVANLGAFQQRYGHACDPLIAGVYGGSFANGGERVQLVDANGLTIRDFTYDDVSPWPAAADGDGPSLVLLEPGLNPDHADPSSWTVSSIPGGLPSGSPSPQSYAAWRAFIWDPVIAADDSVSGPGADPDGDGVCNALEYAFGSDPLRRSAQPVIEVSTDDFDSDLHLMVTVRLSPWARDAIFAWESSSDLLNWESAASSLDLVSSEPSPAGLAEQRFRELSPLSANALRFLRLQVSVCPQNCLAD
ncbi:MAG TPA: lamin tail domain-containing protein [Verrucomicrobiae bacterium]